MKINKEKNGIKAVVFDVGGVLQIGRYSILTFRKHKSLSVHQFMAKTFKIDLDQWFDSIDTPYAKAIEGKITKKEVLSIMSKNLHTSPEYLEKLFIYAYQKYFKQNKKLYQIAFKLKERGYKIAILSDQWQVGKEALINLEIASKFDEVVISCDVGIRKPNPKIYKLITKKLKLNPAQVIFIDNRRWNIIPAKKLGMKTILFTDNRQAIRELKKFGIKI